MSNTYSGTGGAGPLNVRTIDLATDIFGVNVIEVSNGTLTNPSPGVARIVTGGGGGGGGVTNIAFGTTGFTPAGLTSGNVTVAGTLVATHGGTSFNTYATGDLIYASGVNTLSKLTAGADTQVLTLAGGVPTWAAPTGGIAGTIAATQVAFGTGADTIGGDANFSYTTGTGTLLIGAANAGFLGLGTATAPTGGRVVEVQGSNAANNIALFNNTGGTSSFIQFQDTTTADSPIIGSNGNDLVFETQNAAGTIKFETAASVLALELQATGNMRMLKKLSEYNDLPPTDGQLLMGDNAGAVWNAGTLTSTGGTVTITYDAAGPTINFEAAGGSGTPAGGANEVQFNSDPAGTFTADAAFTYANSVITLGDGTNEDIGVLFNSNSTDYYIGRDAGTESFMWGTGTTIGSNSFLTATTAGALTMGTSTTTTIGNVSVTSGGAGSITVGGTGGVSTTDGPIAAGGNTGTISTQDADITVNGSGNLVTALPSGGVPTGAASRINGTLVGTPIAATGEIFLYDTVGKTTLITGPDDNFGLGSEAGVDPTETGFSASYIPVGAAAGTPASISVVSVGQVLGGGVVGTGFTVAQYEPFTIYYIGEIDLGGGPVATFTVYGNVTVA